MAKLVNWPVFEQTIKKRNILIFTPLDVRWIFGVSKVAASFLVHRYSKRNLVVQLKRGLYALNELTIPDPYLANKLCEPSYVSLEFALAYHHIIPESVYAVTSVTIKSTRSFMILGKAFIYRHIKPEAFTGYRVEKQRGVSFHIAEPEKAFVDLMYLKVLRHKALPDRFDKQKLDATKLKKYTRLFNNQALMKAIQKML